MRFTVEQQRFAQEVRTFRARECGALAQRDALTGGGTGANEIQREIISRSLGLGEPA